MRVTNVSRYAVVMIASIASSGIFAQPAKAGGYILWQHSWGRGNMLTPTASTASSGLTLVPINSTATAGVGTSMVNGLQFAPVTASGIVTSNQNLQLVPINGTTVTSSGVGSGGSYIYVPGVQAQPNFYLVTQPGGQTSAGAGVGSSPDNDMSVMASGIGTGTLFRLLDSLKGQLPGLLSQGLSSGQITTLLTAAGKQFLNDNGYGALISVLEPVLTRIVGQLISGNNTPSNNTPSNNTPSNNTPSNNSAPSGGAQRFTVSGTITLTPASGGGGKTSKPTTPQGNGPNPPANGSMPANLTPDPDGGAKPAAPPSS